MGEQVRILDLAEDLIRLSGLEPGRDIEIIFTGIRPGDKLREDLWDEGLKVEPSLHPDIVRVAEQNGPHAQDLQQVVEQLVDRAQKGDQAGVLGLLAEIIPGADIHPNPDLEITSVL
jgi:FlaA1/EpsC-like NDP-sugar epimerase